MSCFISIWNAYEYFGGVTRILVPDNLRTGVTANTRYETQLNESYRELAEHYGTAIVPARVCCFRNEYVSLQLFRKQ